MAGRGIAFVIEDQAAPLLAQGALVRVLADWCEPFDGYHLYYPSRRQRSAAFDLLVGGVAGGGGGGGRCRGPVKALPNGHQLAFNAVALGRGC